MTAAAALAAFALGVPQWAAAQDDAATEPDVTGTDPDVTPADPDVTAPDPDATAAESQPSSPPAMRDEAGGPGAAVTAGGGVTDFSKPGARDFVNTGGTWELRGVFGTRSLIGVEAAYVGAAHEITAPGDSTTLFGNGAEVSARLNILRNGMIGRDTGLQPYALAGVGWKNYQLSGDLATADVDDDDNSYEIPLGAGVAYYFDNGVLLDGRFAYRFSFDDELIQPAGEDEARLDNWSATARLGVEF